MIRSIKRSQNNVKQNPGPNRTCDIAKNVNKQRTPALYDSRVEYDIDWDHNLSASCFKRALSSETLSLRQLTCLEGIRRRAVKICEREIALAIDFIALRIPYALRE